MSLNSDTLIPGQLVLSGEAANINFIVFDFIRTGAEPTIYSTRDKKLPYTTDVVVLVTTRGLFFFILRLVYGWKQPETTINMLKIDKKRNGWRTIFKRTFLFIDYFLTK